MNPFKLARGGIAAILSLILFLVLSIAEAQVANTWERTDAMLKQQPVVANHDYLRVHTQEISPNYWRATVYSNNTQETKTLFVQLPSNQNRFKQSDDWPELARRAYIYPNIITAVETIPQWTPDTGDTSSSLASSEQKPPAKYGRTLAEMREAVRQARE